MYRVLILCEYTELNGAENSLLAAIDAGLQRSFKLTVMAPEQGPLVHELQERQLAHLPFLTHDPTGKRWPQVELRNSLQRAIAILKPDLIHANSLSMARLVGPVAHKLGVPSIAHLRDIVRCSAQAIADLNHNSLILAVSQATKDWHLAAGIHAAKTKVLHNGVDLDSFTPRESTGALKKSLSLSRECRLVGHIGQIGMRKGTDIFVAAACQVALQNPTVHFIIVGKRHSKKHEAIAFEQGLHESVRAAGVDSNFHWLGVRSDIPHLLNEFDLLVHTARQEPLGRVLLEAAASGTPIIATNVGGTAEIFTKASRAGLLVSDESSTETTLAIEALLADSTSRKRLSASARKRAVTAFDIHKSALNLAEQYRAVLSLPKFPASSHPSV